MRRYILAALFLAGFGSLACKPIPPTVGKDWDVVITTNVQPYKFRINTSRPREAVEKSVALCAESVHTYGIESVSQCLKNEGYNPVYLVQ
jgi:hypothetical protein